MNRIVNTILFVSSSLFAVIPIFPELEKEEGVGDEGTFDNNPQLELYDVSIPPIEKGIGFNFSNLVKPYFTGAGTLSLSYQNPQATDASNQRIGIGYLDKTFTENVWQSFNFKVPSGIVTARTKFYLFLLNHMDISEPRGLIFHVDVIDSGIYTVTAPRTFNPIGRWTTVAGSETLNYQNETIRLSGFTPIIENDVYRMIDITPINLEFNCGAESVQDATVEMVVGGVSDLLPNLAVNDAGKTIVPVVFTNRDSTNRGIRPKALYLDPQTWSISPTEDEKHRDKTYKLFLPKNTFEKERTFQVSIKIRNFGFNKLGFNLELNYAYQKPLFGDALTGYYYLETGHQVIPEIGTTLEEVVINV